jgi:hypothetical protein
MSVLNPGDEPVAQPATKRRSHIHDDERPWVIGSLLAMLLMVLGIGVMVVMWSASGRNFTTDLRDASWGGQSKSKS